MNDRKAFTVEIESELSELFAGQCENRKYRKYGAISGAVRLWLALPSDIQVKLMELKNSELLSLDQIIEFIGKNQFQRDLENAFAEFAKLQGIAQPAQKSRQKKGSSRG